MEWNEWIVMEQCWVPKSKYYLLESFWGILVIHGRTIESIPRSPTGSDGCGVRTPIDRPTLTERETGRGRQRTTLRARPRPRCSPLARPVSKHTSHLSLSIGMSDGGTDGRRMEEFSAARQSSAFVRPSVHWHRTRRPAASASRRPSVRPARFLICSCD